MILKTVFSSQSMAAAMTFAASIEARSALKYFLYKRNARPRSYLLCLYVLRAPIRPSRAWDRDLSYVVQHNYVRREHTNYQEQRDQAR